MHQPLRPQLELFGKEMRVDISAEQQRLKKQNARRPDARRATEQGQQEFSDERLQQEKEKRSNENGQRERNNRNLRFHCSTRLSPFRGVAARIKPLHSAILIMAISLRFPLYFVGLQPVL